MDYTMYEKKGYIGILSINRPEALNALNSGVLSELSKQLDDIALSDIRCLIITGSGDRAFAAGADIREMADLNPAEAMGFSGAGNAVMEKIESLPIPAIAAVNGYALGGGFELALACDMIIANEKAVFQFPEAGLGILPGYGGIQRLVRAVGLLKAKELIMTGVRLKSKGALALGLVNEVAAGDGLMDAAMAMAEKISANAPVAIRAIKKIANNSVGRPLEETAGMEADAFSVCFATEDQSQAMGAFLEKRPPGPFAGK